MNPNDILPWIKIGYYTFLGLTPIGTAIGFYYSRKNNKNKYSLKVAQDFNHHLSIKIYHLRHHYPKEKQDKLFYISKEIIINSLRKKTHNYKVIQKALKEKHINQQIKQITIYLKYRDVFKSFEIISIYMQQGMLNKHLVKKEVKKSFEFMYNTYYNKYVSKNMPCKEYTKLCKRWIREDNWL